MDTINTTLITPELLLELGFKERKTPEGVEYVKRGIRLADNGFGWTRCVPGICQPLTTDPMECFTTIEGLDFLERRDGIKDVEVQDFLLQKHHQNQ